ncbi:MAG: 3-methylcrotonyl-CoA carboxylase [Rhodospirillales bacterium]|nr:3-methylcrotonyl-CoA carboxylase [Rhodospirillales bacterium]
MFSKILIANRGEIACRVIRTARRMAIATVAVCSEADRDALHVAMADEAHEIGPAAARDSYLRGEKIIAAALRSGAEAVHPGYGFLSENADFAEACAAAGLVFIGPPVAAIRAMGSKAAAKTLMAAAGVATVPGYHGTAQDLEAFAAAAAAIGYPVLIKASAGGGGKGMRIVAREGDLADALDSARREAASSFGDDWLLIEKFLTSPRHIEMQIFADRHGGCVHLFERDCSIQRRHQKVIEEAPAPGLDPTMRRAMGAAAIAAARAVGYVGAGTVEFIVEGDQFYFMEMNTRLQVEHAVTEMVTGVDLVEWQIRVAAGEALLLGQDAIALAGHAIEARLYAEDPARDFLPAAGVLTQWRHPPEGPDFRVETGVREGDRIGIDYDPMLAKLVVCGEDRAAALRRLREALAGTVVGGIANNVDFLARIAASPDFAAGAVDTGFIAAHRDALLPATGSAPQPCLAAAALAVVLDREAAARAATARSSDPYSPWHRRDSWRIEGAADQVVAFRDGETNREVRIRPAADGYVLDLGAGCVGAAALRDGGVLRLTLDGVMLRLNVIRDGAEITVRDDDGSHRLTLLDPLASAAAEGAVAGRLTAPMPGKIIAVPAVPGMPVARGAVLVVLEAMKMEHAVTAPAGAIVERVAVAVGDLVDEGAELLVLAPAAG